MLWDISKVKQGCSKIPLFSVVYIIMLWFSHFSSYFLSRLYCMTRNSVEESPRDLWTKIMNDKYYWPGHANFRLTWLCTVVRLSARTELILLKIFVALHLLYHTLLLQQFDNKEWKNNLPCYAFRLLLKKGTRMTGIQQI